MKVRFLLLALATALIGASVAVAKDNPGGRPNATGENCRPKVSFILKGTLLSLDVDRFHMNVEKANRHGRLLRGEREIMVDARTRVRRDGGPSNLASLQVGDRLKVQVRGCKRGDVSSMQLLAKRVRARAAAPPES